MSKPELLQGAAALLLVLSLAGCRQDMHDQPKYIPYRPSAFFSDARSERPPIAGTIPRGGLDDETLKEATDFPFAIDLTVLKRGQERFNIYCSPCHGRVGDGEGMVVQRGYRRPPTFHQDRLREAPASHYLDVITNGFGAMPDYAAQIRIQDRWAIIAYIRALQLSQHAAMSDLTSQQASQLPPQSPAPAAGSRRP